MIAELLNALGRTVLDAFATTSDTRHRRRNLLQSSRAGKRSDEDVRLTGIVCEVRDPSTIG
jgi:hypothetical protein